MKIFTILGLFLGFNLLADTKNLSFTGIHAVLFNSLTDLGELKVTLGQLSECQSSKTGMTETLHCKLSGSKVEIAERNNKAEYIFENLILFISKDENGIEHNREYYFYGVWKKMYKDIPMETNVGLTAYRGILGGNKVRGSVSVGGLVIPFEGVAE